MSELAKVIRIRRPFEPDSVSLERRADYIQAWVDEQLEPSLQHALVCLRRSLAQKIARCGRLNFMKIDEGHSEYGSFARLQMLELVQMSHVIGGSEVWFTENGFEAAMYSNPDDWRP